MLDTQVCDLPAFVTDGRHSVSGLSSGAFMAVQIHIAHSSKFVGAGVIAGGPYRSAESFRAAPTAPTSCILNALYVAMTPLTQATAPNVDRLLALLEDTSNIDPTRHLALQKVYIFSGLNDQIVNQYAVRSTLTFYEALGVPHDHMKFVDTINAGHAIITNNPEDNELSVNQPPYLNCGGFFQSHHILDHIYGQRQLPSEQPRGQVLRFYQGDFVQNGSERSSLAEFGYVYIPSNVTKTGRALGVHIALHGCKQGYAFVNYVNGREDVTNQPPFGDRYIMTTGYLEWAEANDLIVLFPQVAAKNDNELQNPDGCWDWWGYTSEDYERPDYFTQNAVQISAIYAMLTRLAGGVEEKS